MKKTQATLPRAEFERLVREHHAAVYASAMRILRDGGAALDVTQDVYVALLEGRITLSGSDDERVLRWFAIRGSLQVLRERANRRLREEHFAMQQPEASLDTSVQDVDAASAVERFVARLPEELRAAVHLRFHEGLTFARIGEALEISEPAAHERVKRALERLKDGLSRAGLAAAAIDVERALQTPPATPPVPLFVAKKLVALQSSTATVSITAALVGSALLVAAVVFVVPKLFDDRSDETQVAVASNVPAAAEGQVHGPPIQTIESPPVVETRASVAPRLQEPGSNSIVLEPVETNGTIVGRVLDDKNRPVQDLIVVASSIERQGKFPRWSARSTTEGDGRFMITAMVGAEGERNYALGLEGGLQLEDRGAFELVRVVSDAHVDVGDMRLVPRELDKEGEFALELHLSDASGAAVRDVNAGLFRAVRSEDGWSDRTFEANAKSDALGRVRLAGRHVGKKIVVVDARDRGFRRLEHVLEVEPGAHVLALTLEKGLEIRGRLVDVDGHAIARPAGESRFGDVLQLHAIVPSQANEWIFAAIEDDGAFTFTGLDASDYNLEISNGPWASICLDGVRAGSQDVVIALKRRDDPLDRGNHCAEIHAQLIDAETGKPVLADVMTSEVVTLAAACTPAVFDADEAVALLHPTPVQTEWSGEYPPQSDRVHAASLAAGTWALVVRAPGYAPEFAAPITLAPHEIKSGIVLSLVRPTRVRGRVLDLDGRPCADAYVFVNGFGPRSKARLEEYDRDVVDTGGHPRAASWDLVRTAADGGFVIEGLSPRYDYVCAALHARRAPVPSARLMGRDPGVVELRFTDQR
jgi:RNA polymerase sigma-70 factor (ECF subfamily)